MSEHFIKVHPNDANDALVFAGGTSPAYWKDLLEANVNEDDADKLDVVNKALSSDPASPSYEYKGVHYSDMVDINGNSFSGAQEAVDYINQLVRANGVSSIGSDLTGLDVNFRLDETSTSVIMDNGSAFGVNTIKAVPAEDGTIHIHAIGAGQPNENNAAHDHKHFEKLEVGRAYVNGSVVAGGLNDVVNVLNELFTVGAFEAVVITDPEATAIADVAGEAAEGYAQGDNAIDPLGDDILGTTATHNNAAGWLSSDSIDQAGEYFTFDIAGKATYGFGLVHTTVSFNAGHAQGNQSYADPAGFCVGANSSHLGYQFSHHFHVGNAHASWTNYGANTSYVMGPAWYDHANQFDLKDEWNAGDPVKVKVGISTQGFIEIATLADDGVSWNLHARSAYPVPQGSSFRLGIKLQTTGARLRTAPKKHLLEPEAPTMNFRWIESPDGTFVWPLFATAEEANYYDEITNGLAAGTGQSHTHTYADDPSGTTWYMPEASHDPATYHHAGAPINPTFNGQAVTYTMITSLTNADLAPPTPTFADLTYEEGSVVNMQLQPADTTYSTSVSVYPTTSGLVYNSATKMLQGTLADVGADTTYTVTVTRGNSYGSRTGSFTITATDVAPIQTNDTPWNKVLDFSGSSERAQQVSTHSNTLPIACDNITAQVPAPTAGQTSNNIYSRPWAATVVFKADRHNSNQHIWNQGGGVGDDNIYLRLAANGNLYFGWGRDGSGVNECLVASGIQSSRWYGIYVGHNGARFSGSNASKAALAGAFDIRMMSSADSFGSLSANLSTSTAWSGGSRMDRNYGGALTIGGRGSNRNFHGKVASFVATTLRCGVAMPDATEIEEMIVDPIKWMNDTKAGNLYRRADSQSQNTFTVNNVYSAYATQIWLMGDGSNDSYSNMIRNRVMPADQNYTKLNLISMVSNDIQTANIPGLT